MTAPEVSFASLLDESDLRGYEALCRLRRLAVVPLAVAASVLVTWAVIAPLSGAIIASGRVKVELNRKTVQHQEGGIVRKILVRDGDVVRAGQPLLVIGDVRNDAELSLLQDQLAAERIRYARASAEAALGTSFRAPADATMDAPTAKDALAREQALFDSRRRTLSEQVNSLSSQSRDAQGQAQALGHQIEAIETSAKLASDELALNEKLAGQGYVQRARVLQLQRDATDYRSRISEAQSELALARQRAGEIQARIAQARNQYQQLAADEAKESGARIREIEDKLRPSRDQAERQYVRAPVDGKVMGLHVAAIGDVVAPREPLLDVVPTREKLVVEARIRPQDINHVREGSAAEVRLTSFDARTTPPLPGAVTFVSPDLVTSQTNNETWFVATVEVDASSLAARAGMHLQAGMPAELYVTTPPRSLFQYLAKPFMAFTSHALREP
jgi:HlyD family type I secretion membrane fusion protein